MGFKAWWLIGEGCTVSKAENCKRKGMGHDMEISVCGM